MGVECSGYYPSGTAQYHINGDIAQAAAFYYSATADLRFLEQEGTELLIETARIWSDLANLYDGKFHPNSVTGPDEYTCMINDNYYTNVCAKNNLRWAVKAFRLLQGQGLEAIVARRTGVTEEELTEFQNVADNMYLPYDKKLRINPQDDSFLQKKKWNFIGTPKEKYPLLLHFHPLHINRYQVCKQADTVLAHFLFEEEQDDETIRNTFLYYEKITTHDSSLSNSIFSIVASRLGLYEKAYDYFNVSAKMDLYYTQNTKDGIHTANMGGTYMAMVFGFAGLRIKEDGLFLRPALPEAWKGYSFKLFYHGCSFKISKSVHGYFSARCRS
jgi:alpha,alpha-trehalose phosphorylase